MVRDLSPDFCFESADPLLLAGLPHDVTTNVSTLHSSFLCTAETKKKVLITIGKGLDAEITTFDFRDEQKVLLK